MRAARAPHPGSLQCCQECFKQAISLYRGEFLADLTIRDSAAFDEWTLVCRERTRLLASRALASLAGSYEQQGHLQEALLAGERYQFEGLNFKLNIGTPGAPNPEAFSTPGAPPWGTDYIWVAGDPKQLAKFTFNGVDYSTFPTASTSDASFLWSGTGDLLDYWAIFETAGGGTLSFDTLWDLEGLWDFGFDQVSTDGGYTWTSLANAYTTYDHDPNAHPTVIANLPGLTGFSVVGRIYPTT